MRTATPLGPYPSYVIVCQSEPPASAPDPRFTARSMLSMGTEFLRALWIASYSVGLPSGSPPPVRAATSMFLISFANSLPRFASTTAFLCFVVAHFEWPLMYVLSSRGRSSTRIAHHVAEVRVHASVTRQLRVERRGQQLSLANHDNLTGGGTRGHGRERRRRGADRLDPRRADEHGMQRPAFEPVDREVGLERVNLPSERIPAHRHVDPAERLLLVRPADETVGEQDHARTGAEDRQTVRYPFPQRFDEVERPGELDDRGRLAARQDQAVDACQLVRAPDRDGPRARGTQYVQVLAPVALQREHTNRQWRADPQRHSEPAYAPTDLAGRATRCAVARPGALMRVRMGMRVLGRVGELLRVLRRRRAQHQRTEPV